MRELQLPVVLLIDTSGSMEENLEILNRSIMEMLQRLKSESREGINIKIMMITFGGEANLHLPLTEVKKIKFINFIATGGTDFVGGIKLLKEKTQEIDFYNSFNPVFILLSDGYPELDGSWRRELESFLQDERMEKAERFALGIGDGYNEVVLEHFTSSSENIFEAREAYEIYNFFKYLGDFIKK